MLLRRIARPLLAAPFVVNGVDTLINPEPRAKKLIQLESHTENPLSRKLTDDPTRLVRIAAASQISGATLLALGRFPRLGALILSANVIPALITEQDFWSEDDRDRRSAKRIAFLKDAGLLGGLLITAADTEGKPSLGWRGRRAAQHAAHTVSDALPLGALATGGSGRTHEAAVKARALAERARLEAADLMQAAREHGPQWAEVAKERAIDLTDTVREHGPEWAEITRQRAAELANRLTAVAAESGPALADNARSRGTELAGNARHRGAELARTARRRGDRAIGVVKEHGAENALHWTSR